MVALRNESDMRPIGRPARLGIDAFAAGKWSWLTSPSLHLKEPAALVGLVVWSPLVENKRHPASIRREFRIAG